jgi:hypothetical protein
LKELNVEQDADGLFPDALVKWAGHREGGVRLPFVEESGRPTGKQIETPLVHRLSSWAQEAVESAKAPRVVMLVGGPGNGKTDAIEGCIHSLAAAIGADCDLVEQFRTAYAVEGGGIPPRKVVIDSSSLKSSYEQLPFSSISLVQDATEGDPHTGSSAELCLLDDLAAVAAEGYSGLYLCCVNRGIVAHAAKVASNTDRYSALRPIIDAITQSVTSKPDAPSCWPLENNEGIAVWPMDVESLFEQQKKGGRKSVAFEVFEQLLAEERWRETCEAGSRCPFCQNRKILSVEGRLDSLIQLLRDYELVSGKRWSFRDLFSLISYLLVGDYSELEVQGKRVTPCKWAAFQLSLVDANNPAKRGADRALYLLASRLYHHRLFPNWPRFESEDYRQAKREVFGAEVTEPGLKLGQGLFRFLAASKRQSQRSSGYVPDRVRDSLAPTLDPALLAGANRTLFRAKDKNEYSVSEVEDRFSLSVAAGLDLVSSRLETLERDLLRRLADADESLSEDNFSRAKARHARLLQATIRQFSVRLVKRSLGVKYGLWSHYEHLRDYEAIREDTKALTDVRKVLRKLLHDESGHFRAYLATTFGQPVAQRSREVSLLLNKTVAVKPKVDLGSAGRPPDPLPYLLVEGHFVGLTFDLYRSLKAVYSGLHPASLPSEIYALLDRVKALVSGVVVRDEDALMNDPTIVVGDSDIRIEFVDGDFEVSTGKA